MGKAWNGALFADKGQWTKNTARVPPTVSRSGLIEADRIKSDTDIVATHSIYAGVGMVAPQFTVAPAPVAMPFSMAAGPMTRRPQARNLTHTSSFRILSPDSTHFLDVDVHNTGLTVFDATDGIDIHRLHLSGVLNAGSLATDATGQIIAGTGHQTANILLDHLGNPIASAPALGTDATGQVIPLTGPAGLGPFEGNEPSPGFANFGTDDGSLTKCFGCRPSGSNQTGGQGGNIGLQPSTLMSGTGPAGSTTVAGGGAILAASGDTIAGNVSITPGTVPSTATEAQPGALFLQLAGTMQTPGTSGAGRAMCATGTARAAGKAPRYEFCTANNMTKWIGIGQPGGNTVTLWYEGHATFASAAASNWSVGSVICLDANNPSYFVQSSVSYNCPPGRTAGIVTTTDSGQTQHSGVINRAAVGAGAIAQPDLTYGTWQPGTLACVIPGTTNGMTSNCSLQDQAKWVGVFGPTGNQGVIQQGMAIFRSGSSEIWTVGSPICTSMTSGQMLIEGRNGSCATIRVGVVTQTDATATADHIGIIVHGGDGQVIVGQATTYVSGNDGVMACVDRGSPSINQGPGPTAFATCTASQWQHGSMWVGIFNGGKVVTQGYSYFRSIATEIWQAGQVICRDRINSAPGEGRFALNGANTSDSCAGFDEQAGVVAVTDAAATTLHFGIIARK
jgi:hypothetical protein